MGERWWIATEELSRGGRKLMGPFHSKALALEVRVLYEAAKGGTYWVSQDKTPEPRDATRHHCDEFCVDHGALR